MTGAALGVDGVDALRLADIAPLSQTEAAMQQEMSRMLEGALEKAVSFPTQQTAPNARSNAMMPEPGPNEFMREDPVGSSAADQAGAQVNEITDRFVHLYVEMTNFSVAWNVAKRTGRDVETLLRAQ